MEELKKELETYIGFEDEVDDVALYDCSSLEERFEDVVVCLYDLIDKNKFRCSEYRNIEEKDEDGEGVCIYCADEAEIQKNRAY